jgi:hypothetical protein
VGTLPAGRLGWRRWLMGHVVKGAYGPALRIAPNFGPWPNRERKTFLTLNNNYSQNKKTHIITKENMQRHKMQQTY